MRLVITLGVSDVDHTIILGIERPKLYELVGVVALHTKSFKILGDFNIFSHTKINSKKSGKIASF
ncbi:hypothetical protein NHP22001_08690 [Helicobacter sp. NHP22-001]|nr:hypothetical protein NHP22001_08690 [Helicobacter sp. NHP22-001]